MSTVVPDAAYGETPAFMSEFPALPFDLDTDPSGWWDVLADTHTGFPKGDLPDGVSDGLLAHALRHADVPVVITDADIEAPGPRIVFANPALCAMTGYTQEDLLGASPRLFQGPDTRREVLDAVRDALESGRPFRGSTVNYRKDGTPYEVEWTIAPLRQSDGTITHWVSTQRNVTARNVRERQVRLFARTVEHATEAICLIEATTREIVYANEAFTDLTGYPPSDLRNASPAILDGPNTDVGLLDGVKAAEDDPDDRRAQYESIFETRDGQSFTAQWRATPIRDADDRLTHLAAVLRDVTDRRELERTLLETRSRMQRDIAAELHDVIGQKLTGLLLRTRVLETEMRNGGTREEAADEAADLREMVRDTLRHVRRQVQQLYPARLDGDGLMKALRDLCDETDALQDVSCTFQLDQPLMIDDADVAGNLYRIAQEALTNAIRHGDAQHILVHLSCPDDALVLTVRDNGKGIDPDVLDRQPGLGLRIMQYRAREMGATLTVTPAEPGTVVTCRVEDIQATTTANGRDGDL